MKKVIGVRVNDSKKISYFLINDLIVKKGDFVIVSTDRGEQFCEVITDIIIVDESKLRYGKIIITADADVDGSHIRILFLTFIWKFAPELIEKGYIYAAVPPLYKATWGTNIKYLKDDATLEAFRKTMNRSFELGRMKGLGEMDTHEM